MFLQSFIAFCICSISGIIDFPQFLAAPATIMLLKFILVCIKNPPPISAIVYSYWDNLNVQLYGS